MRLNHFLSEAGVASRRSAERIIRAGRVSLNKETVTDPAFPVDDGDRVAVDGVPIRLPEERDKVYLMLHKPVGVLSTMAPGREKGACLADLIDHPRRVFPVGRLDRDSSGLVLLTDDGTLAYRLMHPRHRVTKEYLVKTDRPLRARDFQRIVNGPPIDGRRVEVDYLAPAQGGRFTLTIHEGRRHIVRRLLSEIGFRVVELKRVRVGPIHLGRLSVGRWRKLNRGEIEKLKSEVMNENP